MAFSDLAISDLDGVLGLGEASEAVTYIRHNGQRLSIVAVVEKVEPEGFTDSGPGPEPILITVSRSDVVTWDSRDRIDWDGTEYRIKKEMSVYTDSAAWTFYCGAS